MALSQSLQQKQLLKLLPQQIQLMKLLQVPTANLEERIKEEIEENPALEQGSDDESTASIEFDQDTQETNTPDDSYSAEFEDSADNYDQQERDDPYGLDSMNIADYAETDDIAEYRLKDDNYPEFEEKEVLPYRVETSFHDVLVTQLGMTDLSENDRRIAEQVVGSIDEDGYLRREVASILDDLAFRQNIITSEPNIHKIIAIIQQFDPPGVCARDLRECLLLQLFRQNAEGRNVTLSIKVISDFFDEFSKKHYEKIQKALNIGDEELRQIIHDIIRLNPRPGGTAAITNNTASYVVPDFYIINNNGLLELTLNSKNAPDLRVSEGYKDMLRDYDRGDKKDKRQKEAVMFIKQKIDAARWFIDIIKQRQETLYNTMHAIMMQQSEFFLTGDETMLRPMILKDIAEKTFLDISTVSRVANSKFVQTEYGTYRLKYFFSESLSTDSGEEVSTREVKKILSDIIEAENKRKPLSDDVLTDMLNEKGYNIARRTVAKYREQLNVPVARLRKEL